MFGHFIVGCMQKEQLLWVTYWWWYCGFVRLQDWTMWWWSLCHAEETQQQHGWHALWKVGKGAAAQMHRCFCHPFCLHGLYASLVVLARPHICNCRSYVLSNIVATLWVWPRSICCLIPLKYSQHKTKGVNPFLTARCFRPASIHFARIKNWS